MSTTFSVRALSALIALGATQSSSSQTCNSDLDGDGQVNGADLGILLSDWGFCPATIASVSPPQGGSQGGTVITITGTGLGSTTAVRIGGVPCTNVDVLSPSSVRATTPPGQPGPASLSVTTAGGTTLATSPFTYVQQQVTSVAPSSGPAGGGTTITITGQFLAGATAVTVGGVACTNVVSVSSTQVTAVTPPGSVGTADVTVTCTKGTVTLQGGYTFLPITVPAWATLLEAAPDPTVVTDAALRAAITATNRAWRVRDTATGIEMVLIPPGSFQMGCSASSGYACVANESPTRTVTLTNPFYLGRYEVTQAQWTARMNNNPSQFQGAAYPDAASRPVERMAWNLVAGAQGFMSLTGMRLPTEAEWEYAFRAGTTTAFHSMPGHPNGTNQDILLGNIAWFGGNSDGQTHAVGQKAANGFGLHDMSGNVFEFVQDWFGAYGSGPETNPTGPATGTGRVYRGGSWAPGDTPLYCRASFRFQVSPGNQNNNIGFRAARNP